MASYTLIGNVSTIQVTSPLTSLDVEVAVIQTVPSGVIASYPLAEADFTAGTANAILLDFAESIETVLSQGKAVGGSGTSSLDANGLTEYAVTFVVGYNPPGSPAGQITTDVDVPIALLSSQENFGGGTLLGEAEALINTAHENLVKLSKA